MSDVPFNPPVPFFPAGACPHCGREGFFYDHGQNLYSCSYCLKAYKLETMFRMQPKKQALEAIKIYTEIDWTWLMEYVHDRAEIDREQAPVCDTPSEDCAFFIPDRWGCCTKCGYDPFDTREFPTIDTIDPESEP